MSGSVAGRRLVRWHRIRGRWKSSYRGFRDRLLVSSMGVARRLARLVGLSRARRIAGRLGGLAPVFLGGTLRQALENMEHALPDLSAPERSRTAAKMFDFLGQSIVEILLLEDLGREIDRHVHAEGLEILDEAIAQGRGVVVITGHIGNWELMAAFFGVKGYPLTAIATPVKGERLNAANIALRNSVNVETAVRDGPGASRVILRTLKRGRMLAILMDQNTHGQSVEVPFFGRPAPTPVGPAVLSLRAGAAVVGVFIHRQPDGTHLLRVHKPDLPPRSEAEVIGREAWQTKVTARLTALIESEVRAFPAEWVWWHRRWS